MKAKLSKKTVRAVQKSVRKAIKQHRIATGFWTGVTAAAVLSATGVTRRVAGMLGSGLGNLLQAKRQHNGHFMRDLRSSAGEALARAGHYIQPAEEMDPEKSAPGFEEEDHGSTHAPRSTRPRKTS